METVYFKAAAAYDDALARQIEDILSACGIDEIVSPEKQVLLKVNLLMKASPDRAVTTHPALVSAVISVLKRRGVRDIVIADSPGGPASVAYLRETYKDSGMAALARDGVSLSYDLAATELGRNSGRLRKIEVLDAVRRADVVINLGKLKTHAMTGLTAAVKNCFGTVAGLKKSQLHFRFADKADFCAMLCELCGAVAPAISIVDAVIGMEGDGPSGGTPRNFGFVAGSRDPFLLDRALCHALGITPSDALTVGASVELGLAPADAAVLNIAGDRQFFDTPLRDLKLPASRDSRDFQQIPGIFRGLVQRAMRVTAHYPVVRQRACIGCGRCAAICPKKVVVIRDKKAVIDKSSCMRCFCCHEVCPVQAIDIKRLFRKRNA